jgi:hypothetical protein
LPDLKHNKPPSSGPHPEKKVKYKNERPEKGAINDKDSNYMNQGFSYVNIYR